MHPSYFLILESSDESRENELALSAEASEWLFYNKFWDKINSKYEKDFAQYEDETVPAEFTDDMVKSIEELRNNLNKAADDAVTFRYGWNEKKEELMCHISRKVVDNDLGNLSSLFKKAADKKLAVYCQL